MPEPEALRFLERTLIESGSIGFISGVLELWSAGVGVESSKAGLITPLFHYSNTPWARLLLGAPYL
jgi:hypothetical protein